MVRNNDISIKLDEIIQRLNLLKKEIKDNKEELLKAMEASQEDTIEVLTDVINEGYRMHEERLVRVENHLDLPPFKH